MERRLGRRRRTRSSCCVEGRTIGSSPHVDAVWRESCRQQSRLAKENQLSWSVSGVVCACHCALGVSDQQEETVSQGSALDATLFPSAALSCPPARMLNLRHRRSTGGDPLSVDQRPEQLRHRTVSRIRVLPVWCLLAVM
jgi:hypothetical protein